MLTIHPLATQQVSAGLHWWRSGNESTYHFRRCGFHPWVGKISRRRKRQPTPVLLPGKFCGWRSLVGNSPWGQRVGHNWATSLSFLSMLSKVMLKILHASLQHYMNQELPDVQAGIRKGRGTRDQIANIFWIIQKAREFQKKKHLQSLFHWLH